MEETTNKGVAIYIEKSNVDIPGELEIKGDVNHIKVGIEVNGEGSHVTLNKGGDIETQNKVPEIIYTNGANEDNSFEDENKPTEQNIPSKPIHPIYNHTSIIGSDRYDTAAKVADELGSYDTAVLVNATSTMSDGLAASGLAGREDAAILLTKKDSIPKVTMDRLKKVKKVYIIGG